MSKNKKPKMKHTKEILDQAQTPVETILTIPFLPVTTALDGLSWFFGAEDDE